MPRYASIIYNGYWWSPEREMLQTDDRLDPDPVNGTVRLKLYKGNVDVVGRRSDDSLFDENIATFEDDGGAYDQADAEGSSSSTRFGSGPWPPSGVRVSTQSGSDDGAQRRLRPA